MNRVRVVDSLLATALIMGLVIVVASPFFLLAVAIVYLPPIYGGIGMALYTLVGLFTYFYTTKR